jgi:hypothetical protein
MQIENAREDEKEKGTEVLFLMRTTRCSALDKISGDINVG